MAAKTATIAALRDVCVISPSTQSAFAPQHASQTQSAGPGTYTCSDAQVPWIGPKDGPGHGLKGGRTGRQLPEDVLRRNIMAKLHAETAEIDRNISDLKRQKQTHRISAEEFQEAVKRQRDQEQELKHKVAEQLN